MKKLPYKKVHTGPYNMQYEWVPVKECDIEEGDEIQYIKILTKKEQLEEALKRS